MAVLTDQAPADHLAALGLPDLLGLPADLLDLPDLLGLAALLDLLDLPALAAPVVLMVLASISLVSA